MIGRARRPLPIASRPSNCIGSSIAMPSDAVRCSTSSPSPTTGVSQDHPQLAQEIGSQFATRIEGTCVRHRFGKSSIKIYDKFGLVLRIETTTNDVSAFKHYRKVEHQQGPASYALAPVKKNIYSLTDLRHI